MGSRPVERITMFKISEAADRKKVLDQYKVMKSTAIKQDGKPYIMACEAGEAAPEPRAKGWTVVARSTFASKEGMDYYDNECEAHKELKVVAKPVVEDVMTVWFESVLSE